MAVGLSTVVHGIGSRKDIERNLQIVEDGIHAAVSIIGINMPVRVTFRNAEELRSIVRDLPLDRLLVETDAPYLAPVPYRGKRNEPAFVAATAAAVAALKDITPERLAAATRDNFFRLFTKASPSAE